MKTYYCYYDGGLEYFWSYVTIQAKDRIEAERLAEQKVGKLILGIDTK